MPDSQRATLSNNAAMDTGATPPVPGSVRLVPLDQLDGFLGAEKYPPLAVIGFGDAQPQTVAAPTQLAHVELPQLDPVPLAEVWTSHTPVSSGTYQEWSYSHNDSLLFGVMELEEPHDRSLEDAAEEHYQHLFDLITEQGYASILRMWNFFPAMNEEPDGLERYKRFCVGRQLAFEKRFSDYEPTLPAASAIGTQSGHHFTMYFIASRHPGTQVENPRQVSAFCYPRQYGPASPSFSRATHSHWRDGEQLFLSGTASVVGHESRHPGDVVAQLRETLKNVSALCAHARDTLGSAIDESRLGGVKVYVRRPDDLPAIRAVIEQQTFAPGPILYLQGDICRTELLLEIEGLLSLEH